VVEREDFLLIGEVAGVHGVKGDLKISSYADSFAIFKPGSQVIVISPEGGEKVYTIKGAKPYSKSILLSFKGIDNRSSAEALIGAELLIEKTNLPELEEETYYWFDVIGLSVFTVEGEFVGQIDSIIPTGSNDVYVVKDPKRGLKYERLIPALKSVIRSIDLKKKTMRVNLPEGLL
jgi:16S rRNA processing protein RimM